jgi:hypothetical protein
VTADPRFDHEFYLTTYPDVADSGRDPLAHYLLTGWREGHNPNPWFDTRRYLEDHPHCARNGINPLVDYVRHGGSDTPPAFAANEGHDVDVADHGSTHRLPVRKGAQSTRARGTAGARSDTPASRIALVIGDSYPPMDSASDPVDRPDIARLLQRLNYEVHYLALSAFDGSHGQGFDRSRGALEAAGIQCVTPERYPFVEGYYFERSDQIDLCYVSRAHFNAEHEESVRRLCRHAKIVFEASGLPSLDERDKRAPASKSLDRDMTDIEPATAADVTIVASASEKERLERLCPDVKSIFIWHVGTKKNEARSFGALLDQIGVKPPKPSSD